MHNVQHVSKRLEWLWDVSQDQRVQLGQGCLAPALPMFDCAIVVVVAGEGEESVRRNLRAVYDELTERFRQLEEEYR